MRWRTMTARKGLVGLVGKGTGKEQQQHSKTLSHSTLDPLTSVGYLWEGKGQGGDTCS